MLALLLLEVNWISVILCTPKLVSTQLDSYFCIIEERVLPEGYKEILNISSQADFYPLGQSLHYFIVDEVNRLNEDQQMDLRAAMNKSNSLFILTTNIPSAVEQALRTRCIPIDMNAATPMQLLPLARQAIADIDVEIPDADLLKLIPKCNGAIRTLAHDIPAYARKKRRELLKAA
jgi:replication-associated recombination protein RarA